MTSAGVLPETDRGGAVHVKVPATSANVGPGYDSFGLALGIYDEVIAHRTSSGLALTIDGVGADSVPTDESNLVIQAALLAFRAMDVEVPGMSVHCINRIPHGSGQGSSASAIVAGILMARALVPGGSERLTDDGVFALATHMEGHPDNVAPALFGGFTIAWEPRAHAPGVGDAPAIAVDGLRAGQPKAVRLSPHPDVRVIVLTADGFCATDSARAVLPASVPHRDAAANSARAALLAFAITQDPRQLFDATEDWLHQDYRAAVMPETATLLRRLRKQGIAAVLSGAGPSVLILGDEQTVWEPWVGEGFRGHQVPLAIDGATVTVHGLSRL